MADYLHRKSHTHERAREALRKAGHKGPLQKIDALVYAIEVETGKTCSGDTTEFIRAWLDSLPVAARREPPQFRPLTIKPLSMMRHNLDRAALAEPKLKPAPSKNGSENSPIWRR